MSNGGDGIGDGRRSGKTTKAMLAAPNGAVFVWVNHHLHYPKALAHHLKRTDLKIVYFTRQLWERWYEAVADLRCMVM